ncbi:hypothetical protein BLA15945_04915 [Burkholderia lata]|uniref:Uncharacterized protein n=1 Tax=Burkholderia lata (strain ATCC 17760 / DSM 23089 / LMG 22485 / NCIMB 9086 / R18194 / 383) TaxID=482957 RepID=A0A6P2P0L8_BURL3|nr:hypothetical protein BLA15945_04915 [Burkholderia lata]
MSVLSGLQQNVEPLATKTVFLPWFACILRITAYRRFVRYRVKQYKTSGHPSSFLLPSLYAIATNPCRS